MRSAYRRERRYERYREVMRLHEEGISVRRIACILRIDRKTLRRWLRAGSFPERKPRDILIPRSRSIMHYVPFLKQRIGEGVHNLTQLYRELRTRGFCGSYRTVRRWAAEHKVLEQGVLQAKSPPIPMSWRSPRAMTWLLMRPNEKLIARDRPFVSALLEHNAAIADATEIARSFIRIIRERKASELGSWIEKARTSALMRFSEGIEREREGVEAALRLPWSNGPVEGHVHRLKAIKRQMYGRAKFDLLRKRVLYVA